MIRVTHLTCSANGKRILDDVSLQCPTGMFVGILGPNGAGKSTLIKHLCGLRKAPAGTVFIDEKDLREHSPKELARRVGYVPQAKPIECHFTVFDIVLLGRYPHLSGPGQPSKEDCRAALDALDRVGMGAFANQRAATLSGGELQKVYLAAAIAQATPILLVDEPTAFLDPKHERDIWLLLKALVTNEGRTVLAVTHAVRFMESLSDHAILMKAGRIVVTGESQAVLTHGVLRQLYDIPSDQSKGNGQALFMAEPSRCLLL